MEINIIIHYLFTIITLYARFSSAGFCTQSYSCQKTCYYQSKYSTKCGLFGWKRCTRYRQKSRPCTKTCYRQVCCKDFTGSNCNTPLCFGSTTCPNGGTCRSPNNCECKPGYSKPRCNEIDECSTGASGCSQICTNTPGSFSCSCRSGYMLSTDLKTCVDINECHTKNGQCEHICINEAGNSRCECRSGYKLNRDGRTCSDMDECSLRTANCDHTCTNTQGSYTCSCRPGYVLDIGGHKCNDVDECSSGTDKCGHTCQNTLGSYTCSCNTGFVLGVDEYACQDKNECLDENGLCEQVCTNEVGTYTCGCTVGYELMEDMRSCKDIDECTLDIDGCSQNCTNGVGSYTCSCASGYEAQGKHCININECTSSPCTNGGTCLDEINSFTCICPMGFTGSFCEQEINECSFLNGGCQEICTNEIGSFKCSCHGNKTLGANGKSCAGTDKSEDVFRRHKLARKLLPRGCATLFLTECSDGDTIDVFLSSTSEWYRHNTNPDITFTLGIVFVEVNDLSLPISLNGVEVIQGINGFQINLGTNGRTAIDGQVIPVTRTDDCLLFELTASDIYEFVSSVSFLKTLLDRLIVALPPWLGFGTTPFSALDVSDLQTDLVYGRDMDDSIWCQGAPVIPDHLYSVFRFSSEFSLSLYGNSINIPKPLRGRKFCLIVDICHNFGGSVFLMIPEESRDLLLDFDFFKDLHKKQGLTIQPRGIGLSVVNGVNVHSQTTELQLWNGDTKFTYPVFNRADLWIGGNMVKESKTLKIQGSADLFVNIPSPARMLTAIFIDEWNILANMKASATPTVYIKMFKKVHKISFVDMATASINAYLSIGGTFDRKWCGNVANPPGFFLSSLITINPFQTVPILKDWVFDMPSKLYAFVTSDPASKITDEMSIDILKDILQVQELLDRFKEFVNKKVAEFGNILTETTKTIIDELKNILATLIGSVSVIIEDIAMGNIQQVINRLSDIWDKTKSLENIVTKFLDNTEHFVDETKDEFTIFIKNKTDLIKLNLDKAISNVRNQVISAAKDYSGVGLKFRTSLNFLGLKIIGVDVEFVYSVNSLLQCSRFDKVKQLLAGEKAARFLGQLSKGVRLGYFLKLDVGAGIGGAFSIDTDKFVVQLNAYASMLGIKATGDLFISKSGLYLYIEGNVWDIFLAQIDISAETGKEWYHLEFTLRGRFVAKARRRRQVQTVSNSFQASYLDALKKVVRRISDEAEKRLSQAQEFLSKAKNGLSQAQNWLEEKKSDVRGANKHFDNAVQSLERAKDKLESAKGPFKRAIDKLNSAQKKVDNICKIKKCSKICVPGVKCKICHKKIWGVKIPYPCCKFTSCMIKLPNPICEAANLICKGVRAVAFAALEAAKLFVRIPMLALDAAKAGVSVAQFAVDKSRVVLVAAEGLLELAKIGLEAAKFTLEAAKQGLELVKKAIGVAAKILELVIEYGIKNLIDVRNCGFEVSLSTVDLPVFDVSCEVNAFRLGWRKVGIRINFKNILQSLWQAAKATIDALKQSLGNLISGRKRREVDYVSSSHLHKLLRTVRQAEANNINSTSDILDNAINVVNETLGFAKDVTADGENRILLYRQKCELFKSASVYLEQIFGVLYEIVNDTNTKIDALNIIDSELQSFSSDELKNNVGLIAAGVDTEYLMNTYNVTMSQILAAVNETKSNFQNNTFINELSSIANLSRQITQTNLNSIRSDQLLGSWAIAVENGTHSFFNDSQCIGFSDCIFYAITTLYEIHIEENYYNINKSKASITSIENEVLKIMNDTTLNISEIFNMTTTILSELEQLKTNIPFCKSAPRFVEEPNNTTALVGRSISLTCQAESADGVVYMWYRNGEMIQNWLNNTLILHHVTQDDDGYYECVIGNDVADRTSRRAWLTVTDNIDSYPDLLQAECKKQSCPNLFPCYVPHPQTCTKFILCQRLQSGNYVAHVMECGFGTLWKKVQNTQICDRAENVNCTIDPCKNSSLKSYNHHDNNPRSYWKCVNNRSIPDCCPHHHRFDTYLNKCVQDITSTQSCALKNDDSCTGTHVEAVDDSDGNCRTYFECINGHPHPACCPDYMEYDIFKSKCVTSTACNDSCTHDSTALCSRESITSYKNNNTNCRTFMKCNSLGNGREPFCCSPGQEYDVGTQSCVISTDLRCIETDCPTGYTLNCSLEALDQNGTAYRDSLTDTVLNCPNSTYFDQELCQCVTPVNHGSDCSNYYRPIINEPSKYQVKDHDWITRECAPGTVFDPSDCVCKFSGLTPKPMPRKGCIQEVHLKLPYIENLGSALAVALTTKDSIHTPSRYGNMSELWDGSDGIILPFYSMQRLSTFFFEVTLKPTEPGTSYKQVILSSCLNTGDVSLNSMDGLPTLELALMRFTGTNGIFKLQIRSEETQNMIEIDTPFMFNTTYTYRIIYNGDILALQQVTEETENTTTCGSQGQALNKLNIINEFRNFTGRVDIGAGGLILGRCEQQNITSFIGYMSEIKFSRCLTNPISQILTDIQKCRTDWNTIWTAMNMLV